MEFGPETIFTKTVGLSRLEFRPHGSRFNLDLGGYNILTTATRGGDERKKAWSHPCSPLFDEDPSGLGLPRHGFMRNSPITEIVLDTPDTIRTRFVIAQPTYPSTIIVEQNYRLTERYLEITTSHANEGNEPAPVNFGDHFYFNSPMGNEGIRMNRKNLIHAIQSDAALPFDKEQLLEIPGLPKLLVFGYGRRVLNPWVDVNTEGVFDSDYFCLSAVERNFRPDPSGILVPGNMGTPESMIAPGQLRTSTVYVALAA